MRLAIMTKTRKRIECRCKMKLLRSFQLLSSYLYDTVYKLGHSKDTIKTSFSPYLF